MSNEDQQLRADIDKMGQLARDLFEQQFRRCGGRKPADPTWDELEESERDEWWERALDAAPLLAERDATIQQLRDKLDLPCGSCHPCMHWSSELWRRIDREPPTPDRWAQTVDERNALLVEVERLRREVEFEANAEPYNHDWMNFSLRPCACLPAGAEVPAGWSRPVCAVHPEEGQ